MYKKVQNATATGTVGEKCDLLQLMVLLKYFGVTETGTDYAPVFVAVAVAVPIS